MTMTQPETNPGYRQLSPRDWHAYESSLKGLLRVREPQALGRHATEAAGTLHQIQTLVLHRSWRWPLQYLPLMLCRGPARSGANFLRWRNQQNTRSGTVTWQALIQDPQWPQEMRDALLAIECDRVMFNMQMSVTTFILRQIRECRVKMTDARQVMASVSSCNNNTGGKEPWPSEV
ncbi:DUF3158 family protein [Buttiauxella selenatireducens]|uniref:DUF3158 family protein n=1 Tax=Buttiauxella selenatireducens TaxID=3073902 RepID=A0ABY9S662_9ENTR|nr:DUF3158 family protein [Buttiauxella sp. R73]WMY72515.1 DUF3158 family protein [Buttiauxella sp. R73]